MTQLVSQTLDLLLVLEHAKVGEDELILASVLPDQKRNIAFMNHFKAIPLEHFKHLFARLLVPM